ncbi:MAG: pyridoxal-phosphate dependent enzyme [Chitinophagales bacterium]|nr:pyridoxal-phosphate dependent enzyme [Chitinophagales bacterium]
MKELRFENITVDSVTIPLFAQKKIELSVLRIDKLHEIVSGNKWFKLRYYISDAIDQQKKHIVTFGGAYSNHIVATAAACQISQLACTGIIRGEEPSSLSPTLLQAKELGMQLVFTSREEYAVKKLPDLLNDKDQYIINEGGYGRKGAKGATGIADHFTPADYSHICCAVGTGTMMAGLLNALPGREVIGISTMKNNFQLENAVRQLLKEPQRSVQLFHDYHFGGYAKYKPELLSFMNDFYKATGIPSDFVYTGKLFYAVNDLASKDFFPPGSKLLLIHSGGLQGNRSLSKDTLIF